ncbi:hypothetical protein [Luteimonas vadosa]|uniref:TonB C-terminal domain-containing protein n=1 Tax=Luteimonas vadosa TaxID=1165507 RepID=A0ABP9DV94_9GAMM
MIGANDAKLLLAAALAASLPLGVATGCDAHAPVSVRTEQFPRPPYSGATYAIYERGGAVVCTTLEVCNKFDQCDTSHHAGPFKDPVDEDTGEPYGTSPAVRIPPEGLRDHACLVRFAIADD